MNLDTDPAPEVIEFNFRGYTLIEGINYAKNHKVITEGVKKGTAEEYDGTISVLKDFFKHEGLSEKFWLRDLSYAAVIRFFDYLKSERKNSNKSYNNRRSNFHAASRCSLKKIRSFSIEKIRLPVSVSGLPSSSRKEASWNFPRTNYVFSNVPHFYIGDREIPAAEFAAMSAKERRQKGAMMVMYHGPGERRVSEHYFYKRLKIHLDALGYYQINSNYTLYSF